MGPAALARHVPRCRGRQRPLEKRPELLIADKLGQRGGVAEIEHLAAKGASAAAEVVNRLHRVVAMDLVEKASAAILQDRLAAEKFPQNHTAAGAVNA